MYNGIPNFKCQQEISYTTTVDGKNQCNTKNIVTFSQIVFKFQYDRMKLSKVSSSLRLGNKLRVMAFQKTVHLKDNGENFNYIASKLS